jgi:hypothetical protein
MPLLFVRKSKLNMLVFQWENSKCQSHHVFVFCFWLSPWEGGLILNDNKDLKGDISPLCQALDTGNEFFIRADCRRDDDDDDNGNNKTQLICSCCYCCDPANKTDCNYGAELAQYDPTWQTLYNRESYLFTDPNWN